MVDMNLTPIGTATSGVLDSSQHSQSIVLNYCYGSMHVTSDLY